MRSVRMRHSQRSPFECITVSRNCGTRRCRRARATPTRSRRRRRHRRSGRCSARRTDRPPRAGNNCLKLFGRLQALARPRSASSSSANPKWAAACGEEAARKLDGVFMPAAATARSPSPTRPLNGEGDSLFSETIYSTQARADRGADTSPPGWRRPSRRRRAMRMDIEGAEYAVMRRLLVTGQACRLASLVFEAHALYSDARQVPRLRSPAALAAPRLPDAGGRRGRALLRDARIGGVEPMGLEIDYQRQILWKPGWCRSCPLLDEIVAPDAT